MNGAQFLTRLCLKCLKFSSHHGASGPFGIEGG